RWAAFRHRAAGRTSLHPGMELRLHRVADGAARAAAYAVAVSAPTVPSLERTSARQQTLARLMRPLAFAAVVLVVVIGIRIHPGPGLHGESLGILVALVAFAAGVAGVMGTRRRSALAQVPF